MSKPIRTMYPTVIVTGAGEILAGDTPSKFGKIVVEVHNQTFDARAFLGITPEQARELAATLVQLADRAEGVQS